MGGRVRVGVAGFCCVGWVLLGALGPVDVVVSGVGVGRCGGSPSEEELSGGGGGREGVYGSSCRR